MRAFGLISVVAVLSGCWNFQAQLDGCRDDAGAWRCGSDAGGGGGGGSATGGGGGMGGGGATGGGEGVDAGSPLDATGLACAGSWCWEHPRPMGAHLEAIWGRSENDIWVAGERGALLHFDGGSWTWLGVDPNLDIGTLCGTDTALWLGGWGIGELNGSRLRRLSATGLESVDDPTGNNVNAVSCGTDGIYVAASNRIARVDEQQLRLTPVFPVDSANDEECGKVFRRSTGEVLVGCRRPNAVRLYHLDAGLAFERSVDAGARSNQFRFTGFWEDRTRGLMASIGDQPGEVWQENLAWGSVWTHPDPYGEMRGGAAGKDSSWAVGMFGHLVQFPRNGGTPNVFSIPLGDSSVLDEAWVPPGQDRPWIVGQNGCVLAPSDGGWREQWPCTALMNDLSLRGVPQAITSDARYERQDSGWVKVGSAPPGSVAFAPIDGGVVYLTSGSLYVKGVQRGLTFTDARWLAVANDERIVIVTRQGELIETGVTNTAVQRRDAGAYVPGTPFIERLFVDEDGTLWMADVGGVVLRSPDAGVWIPEQVGLDASIIDVSAKGGRVWAVTSDAMATRDSNGQWRTMSLLPDNNFYRVVALSDTEALAFQQYVEGVRVDATLQGTVRVQRPLQGLPGRLWSRDGEVWGVGSEGAIIRWRPSN